MILDLNIDAYHASPRVSHSKLRTYAELGPYAYRQRYIMRNTPDTETPEHFTFGSILEDIVQGRPFDQQKYAVKPDSMTFVTKEGKAWKSERLAEGREIISAGDMRVMTEMTLALSENASALRMIEQCVQQPTLYADYEGTPGLQARPDWASESARFSLDLKTTKDLSDITSGRSVRSLGYHSQAAMVRWCAGESPIACEQWLLAVAKKFPFRCQLVKLPRSWVDAGEVWCDERLEQLSAHYEGGAWPRVHSEIAKLPEWRDDGGRKEGAE